MIKDKQYLDNLFEGLGKKRIQKHSTEELVDRVKKLRVAFLAAKTAGGKASVMGQKHAVSGNIEKYRYYTVRFTIFNDRAELIKAAVGMIEDELKVRESGDRERGMAHRQKTFEEMMAARVRKYEARKKKQELRKIKIAPVEYGASALFAEHFGKRAGQ